MKIKQIEQIGMVFLACTAGMVILQLAAPIILGILVNVISFAVPFAIYHFFFAKKWRIHLEKPVEGENEDYGEREEAENCEEPVEAEPQEESEPQEEVPEQVCTWYQEQGKERIGALASKLDDRQVYEFWIRTDGICNILTPRGYRRTGNLPGYPGAYADAIAVYLRREGFHTFNQGKYLHVSWGEE